MRLITSLAQESRLIRWLVRPPERGSVFAESRVFGFFWEWLAAMRRIKRFLPDRQVLRQSRWLLLALVFFSIFVPRLPFAILNEAYTLDLRSEDIFLAILGLVIFGVTLRRERLPEAPHVERSFLLFLSAAGISILNGLWLGTIDKPLLSLLVLLKWVEYFLLFVIAYCLVRNAKDSRLLLKAFFSLGILIALYGFWEHFFPSTKATYPNYYRLFERPPFHGDANHVGGLLAIWIGFFGGIFLRTRDWRRSLILLGGIVLVYFPLIWTYSRKSYFALAAALLIAFLFRDSWKKNILLISLLVFLGLAFPTRLAERLSDLGEAFAATDPFHSSWAGNWAMWKEALWNFEDYFLFGSGFGSRHRLYYESHYVQILSETGIVGFLAFGFLCWALFREVAPGLGRRATGGERGVALGWLMAFTGLLVHSASCVSFTVSKIVIPFWFLTAVVLGSLRRLKRVRP